MKVIIEQSVDQKEVEIIIRCNYLDESLQELVNQIRAHGQTITCRENRLTYTIPAEQIFYFETVDDKLFAYCQDEIHECKSKLHEVEVKLKDLRFIRISKSSILNLNYLMRVKPLLNGKYEATLLNGEKLIISRNYVPNVKKKMGIDQ